MQRADKIVIEQSRLRGAWSATLPPFTDALESDVSAVERLIEHHLALGVKGLFVGGSCGEGPFIPRVQ
jgi:dihydrodipicolinate synthase/N-acetylneuraminate lyase